MVFDELSRSRFGFKLERLYLDFIGCVKLTDAGLYALSAQLPSSLEDLELHFAPRSPRAESPKKSRSTVRSGEF